MYDTEQLAEKFILVAVESGTPLMSTELCLKELEDLVETAGGEVVGTLVQKREGIHPKHYLGKGKLEELKGLATAGGAGGIVCDDELSPVQLRSMQEVLSLKVMDRTTVILDIFASRASSAEGKAQVELAQLKYRLSHLSGLGLQLSRLGGGIGTRGPGEKKLETDRRHIQNRITDLNGELLDIQSHRQVVRGKREKNAMPVISMVGYTNAGKSTLFNRLTGAGVLAEDKLFATLDTSTKKLELPGGSIVLYTDTVGFIQKLPHNLIKSFRATLEELQYADILVHVVDVSNPSRQEQMNIVYQTLSDLKLLGKPIITVMNKIDSEDIERPLPSDGRSVKTLPVSAKTGEGLADFLDAIAEAIKSAKTEMTVLIPYKEGGLLSLLYGSCDIIEESHNENGTLIHGFFNGEGKNRFQSYIV